MCPDPGAIMCGTGGEEWARLVPAAWEQLPQLAYLQSSFRFSFALVSFEARIPRSHGIEGDDFQMITGQLSLPCRVSVPHRFEPDSF